MFEKRLMALTHALGITFLVLIVMHIISFAWVLLFTAGSFNFLPFLGLFSSEAMVNYILNLKLMILFFGSLYLICWLWNRKLKEISTD